MSTFSNPQVDVYSALQITPSPPEESWTTSPWWRRRYQNFFLRTADKELAGHGRDNFASSDFSIKFSAELHLKL
jgi:hypothetical protein